MVFLKRYRSVLIFLLNLILISVAYGLAMGHSQKKDPASVAKEKSTIDHYLSDRFQFAVGVLLKKRKQIFFAFFDDL